MNLNPQSILPPPPDSYHRRSRPMISCHCLGWLLSSSSNLRDILTLPSCTTNINPSSRFIPVAGCRAVNLFPPSTSPGSLPENAHRKYFRAPLPPLPPPKTACSQCWAGCSRKQVCHLTGQRDCAETGRVSDHQIPRFPSQCVIVLADGWILIPIRKHMVPYLYQYRNRDVSTMLAEIWGRPGWISQAAPICQALSGLARRLGSPRLFFMHTSKSRYRGSTRCRRWSAQSAATERVGKRFAHAWRLHTTTSDLLDLTVPLHGRLRCNLWGWNGVLPWRVEGYVLIPYRWHAGGDMDL